MRAKDWYVILPLTCFNWRHVDPPSIVDERLSCRWQNHRPVAFPYCYVTGNCIGLRIDVFRSHTRYAFAEYWFTARLSSISYALHENICKTDAILAGGQNVCGFSRLQYFEEIRPTYGGETVDLTCLPSFKPYEVPWYSFLLVAE
jgi:hypothetical protein